MFNIYVNSIIFIEVSSNRPCFSIIGSIRIDLRTNFVSVMRDFTDLLNVIELLYHFLPRVVGLECV